MENPNNSASFVVTARKWRPLIFKDVVGQEHITTTLKNAISANRIHHAYIFSGPRGVGKTTTARILARAINCQDTVDSEPCNKCDYCLSVLEGRSLDVIEIDGASNNSVDDIRKLRENSKYPPSIGKYKLYIIDEVHMLSTSAFNALLKTLEEPPPHLMFVFATTEMHKVPATILSRCQRHVFRSMEINELTTHLKYIADKEGISIDDASLITIAKKGDGSMRDSQSVFDQVVAFCGKDIKYSEMADSLHLVDQDFFFQISFALANKDINLILELSNSVQKKGYDISECVTGLIEHFRNILTIVSTGKTNLIEDSSDVKNRFKEISNYFSKPDILRILNLLSVTEQSLKFASQPKIKFEVALVQLASMDKAIELAELIKEIKSLKNLDFTQVPVQQTTPKVQNESILKQPTVEYKTEKIETNQSIPDKVQIQKESDEQNIPSTINNSKSSSSDADSLERGWKGFIQKYANGSTGLSYLHPEMVDNVKFLNGEILLFVGTTFIFDNLNSKKNIIINYLTEYYNTHVNVKILNSNDAKLTKNINTDNHIDNNSIIDKIINLKNENNNQSSPDTDNNIKTDVNTSNLHPFEKLIIENFNTRDITR